MIPSLRRMAAVARVEGLLLVTDKTLLSIILIMPIVQILLYGYAINLNPRHVPFALAADDVEAAQPALEMTSRTDAVRLIGPVGKPGSAEAAVHEGRAEIGLELRKSGRGAPASARVVADAGDPATVGPAVRAIETRIWREVARNYAAEDAPRVAVSWVHNGTSSDRINDGWSVAPGLVGMIVMISMLFLGSFTLVREREHGSWETLLATPATPADALAGKLAPYLVIGVLDSVILLYAIHWLFEVPLPAASWALVAVSPLYAGAYLILGFAFSALARTQMQAAQGAIFFYLPSLLLSGFLFPFEGMPGWAKAIGEAMPLTHYLRATRDVLIRGRGPEAVWVEVWPILLFGVLSSVFAILAYRRRLD
jgi:ABC-2 type transport system permease protein